LCKRDHKTSKTIDEDDAPKAKRFVVVIARWIQNAWHKNTMGMGMSMVCYTKRGSKGITYGRE
jgi:hypothetical protein